MDKSHFLELFRKELSYLQEKGKIFAEQYPHIASHLDITHIPSEDPHISRLIESVAFLNAMVQGNIEEDYSRILKPLNDIAFPNSQVPLPSVGIVHWEPESPLEGVLEIPRATAFIHPKYIFSSVFDMVIPPFQFLKPQYLSYIENSFPKLPSKLIENCIHIPLKMNDNVNEFNYFNSDIVIYIKSDLQSSTLMFERLLTKCEYIAIHQGGVCLQVLDRSALSPYGYEESQQSMLQNQGEAFWIQYLWLEYFHCPEKLLFLKLKGVSFKPSKGAEYSLNFYSKDFDFNHLAHVQFSCQCLPVANRYLVTGIAVRYFPENPIINLLAPVSGKQSHVTEYHVIESVTGINQKGEEIKFAQYFDNIERFECHQVYWVFRTERSLSTEGELSQCEIEIFDPDHILQKDSFVSVNAWASHRQFMKRSPLPVGSPFETKGGKATLMTPITPQRFMAKGKAADLMYCSHLEIQDFFGEKGVAKLARMLHLHDSRQTFATRKVAKVISDLKLKMEYGSVLIGRDRAFLSGTGIHLYLNEEDHQDVMLWPLVCIIEEFFAFSAHLNTYIKLYVYKNQGAIPFYTSARRHGKRRIA